MAEALGSTAGADLDTRAQEAAKEATPKDPSARVGSATGGGSQAEEVASRKPVVLEVEVVSVSSDEPSDLAEMAQPSRVEGLAALMWVG
jgi:hypothetical protein